MPEKEPFRRKLSYYARTVAAKTIDFAVYQVALLSKTCPREMHFSNLEGHKEFDFSLPLDRSQLGISAFVRAKNEESKIKSCLLSIIDVFDEIIFVDNNSQDDTFSVVEGIKNTHENGYKVKLFKYPFSVSRFGREYSSTEENSVYNFAYLSNFALSHCSYKYVCKWDADMLFRPEVILKFKNFLKTKILPVSATWNLFGQTVYRDLDENCWLSSKEIYREPRIFPTSYFHRYVKGKHFEVLKSPSLNLQLHIHWGKPLSLTRKGFPEVAFFELKEMSQDEFAHWSTTEFVTDRKKKEWEVFELMKSSKLCDKDEFSLINIAFDSFS